jgi:hypothetical protein
MNSRIYDRNIPSQMLQPYISVRPVMTKYSFMPIVDPRKELSVKLEQQPTYNSNIVFNPGNDMAPWSGYSSGINVESELRGQIYALQKCDQAVYVPNISIHSSLYLHLHLHLHLKHTICCLKRKIFVNLILFQMV